MHQKSGRPKFASRKKIVSKIKEIIDSPLGEMK